MALHVNGSAPTAFESSHEVPLTMDLLLSEPAYITDVEEMIMNQQGSREVPFSGMDKSGRGVCVKNELKACRCLGAHCPLRHIIKDKQVVCKHWLRGLCKKGDQCEFLHEYDLSKMPECFFFSKYLACSNRECPFRHIDPESKIKDCPWYDRGFCRHGAFVSTGIVVEFSVRFFCLVSALRVLIASSPILLSICLPVLCHNCHERGHKATHCPHLPTQQQLPQIDQNRARSFNQPIDPTTFMSDKKNLSEVTCYKCGEKGHYANRCKKGVLAFLSNTAHLAMEQRERDQNDHRLRAGAQAYSNNFSRGNSNYSNEGQEN
uniref:Cleavage and polyadenylation specificity factor subunit 4 n=1 Tax=Ditylenchus dipsaci TaxID=166011 RepID=A0A915EHF5_9BILA